MRVPYITLLRERLFLSLVLVLGALTIPGCASWSSAVSGLGPVGDALRFAGQTASRAASGNGLDTTRLPTELAQYEYMQLAVSGWYSLMALGRRDRTAVPQYGEDEYWYSPLGEMLHSRDGRLWRVLGMTTEWRGQQAQAPAWSDVPAAGQELSWVRKVDRMPGYRWAEVDRIRTRRLLTPPSVAAHRTWPQAQWFEDEVQAFDAVGLPWQYTQRFAVWQGRVMYSEQCIARDLCLSMTRVGRLP